MVVLLQGRMVARMTGAVTVMRVLTVRLVDGDKGESLCHRGIRRPDAALRCQGDLHDKDRLVCRCKRGGGDAGRRSSLL